MSPSYGMIFFWGKSLKRLASSYHWLSTFRDRMEVWKDNFLYSLKLSFNNSIFAAKRGSSFSTPLMTGTIALLYEIMAWPAVRDSSESSENEIHFDYLFGNSTYNFCLDHFIPFFEDGVLVYSPIQNINQIILEDRIDYLGSHKRWSELRRISAFTSMWQKNKRLLPTTNIFYHLLLLSINSVLNEHGDLMNPYNKYQINYVVRLCNYAISVFDRTNISELKNMSWHEKDAFKKILDYYYLYQPLYLGDIGEPPNNLGGFYLRCRRHEKQKVLFESPYR